MARERRKMLTVAEARALANQKDLDAISKSAALSNLDVIEATVYCVVCGSPAKTALLRTHVPELIGAKWLCPTCENDKGYAWMSTMTEDGSVLEDKPVSTVEENATPDGDSNKVAQTLFGSTSEMGSSRQNPISSYQIVRTFDDDTLLQHMKHSQDHKAAKQNVTLYCDNNSIFSL